MKIVFMGTPQFAVPILEALQEKYEVVLVVSQPNRVKKKGVLQPTPVAEYALSSNLDLFQPEVLKDGFQTIADKKADLLVTAAYGQYVPSKILNLFKKTINVHGSILPLYRGGAPIQRAIMNGDTITGVTLIEMAKKLDAGKMYAKRSIAIDEEDTASTLFNKLSLLGRDLLMEQIEDIYHGLIVGEDQIEEQVTYAPNLTKEEEKINFHQPARRVARQINGLSSDPGAYFEWQGMPIKVFQAKAISYDQKVEPGTILSLKKQFLVQAEEGAVLLDGILIPGKKRVDAKSFVNGQKILHEHDVILS